MESLQEQICLTTKRLDDKNLIAGRDGNVSCRDNQSFLITPSNVNKANLRAHQIVRLNKDFLPERQGARPSGERLLHHTCYQMRPDINAVVHAHPASAVALSLTSFDFSEVILPEMFLAIGAVAKAPYAIPVSQDLADSIKPFIPSCNAVILTGHGAVCVGRDLAEASDRMESLEHSCKIILGAMGAGQKLSALPPSIIAKLEEIRKMIP